MKKQTGWTVMVTVLAVLILVVTAMVMITIGVRNWEEGGFVFVLTGGVTFVLLAITLKRWWCQGGGGHE